MQKLTIPELGDEVDFFFTYDGDEEVSGPFAAIVLGLDIVSAPYPLLDLRVCYPFDSTLIARAVPFRSGVRYWLPKQA